jgi:hypothetical protein
MRSASSCDTAGAEDGSVASPSPCGRLASRTIGSLITPGFGGRVYFPTGKGFIVLQVQPKAKP